MTVLLWVGGTLVVCGLIFVAGLCAAAAKPMPSAGGIDDEEEDAA